LKAWGLVLWVRWSAGLCQITILLGTAGLRRL
jgi:hypothetical protein